MNIEGRGQENRCLGTLSKCLGADEVSFKSRNSRTLDVAVPGWWGAGCRHDEQKIRCPGVILVKATMVLSQPPYGPAVSSSFLFTQYSPQDKYGQISIPVLLPPGHELTGREVGGRKEGGGWDH